MDIHDFNPSRRRFLSGMLAVGATSALAPNPLISKVWAAGKIPNSGFNQVRTMALLKPKWSTVSGPKPVRSNMTNIPAIC